MYNFIKDKSRFLVFDVNSRFINSIEEEEMKEIVVKNITTDNFGMPIIDALELLEEKTKVIYNIETKLIGTPCVMSLIEAFIEEILKVKNKNSENYAIIILDNRNINNDKLIRFEEVCKSKDVDIVVVS